jgi:CHAD domain-containing protein
MNVDVQIAIRPLRKLYKELKDFPAEPSPEQVHELRTQARRLEAVVHTFSSDSEGEGQRLVKLMKPLRKAAGKVRDVDVFIAKLHQIEMKGDEAGEGLVRLIEHVASRREKHLGRLHRAIARRGKQIRRSMRHYGRWLESGEGVTSPAAAQTLAAELDNWPKLQAGNLHEFRIRAKELRYMLQLLPDVDRQRIEALGEVKDLTGEWHDWLELRELAEEILDPAADHQTLKQIGAMTREKLRAGLAAANRLRDRDRRPRAA